MTDIIEKCKRILALVDTYHERPSAASRTDLRKALYDEFEAAITAPTDAKDQQLTFEAWAEREGLSLTSAPEAQR